MPGVRPLSHRGLTPNSMKLPPDRIRALFVDRATAKFARNVPDFVALQALVREQGGTFRNDHGAIRVGQGETVTGSVTFQLPASVPVSRVQWTSLSGFGSTVGWNVHG